MKKRFLALAAAGSVFGIAAAAISTSVGLAVKINAEEESHVHNASCQIHHYARVNPTSKTSGIKEYWICCNDFNHKVEFAAPSAGTITDATHGEGFAVEDTDERYIPSYTIPEVFSTPYAYETPVTIEDGKVISNSSAIKIRATVLAEAYEAGYTHMKFHSKGTADDAAQVLSIADGSRADDWKFYSKRYASDNDNRIWLKALKENGIGLLVKALQKDSDTASTGGLILSDFSLFKSSVTESWGGGSMNNWAACAESNRYIAYENGELVMDNAGAGEWSQAGEIPASIMGNDAISENRAFAVKRLSTGIQYGRTAQEGTMVAVNYNSAAFGYQFKKADGTQMISSDGFITPTDGDGFGLHRGHYDTGALSVGLDYPGAVAIRINYDLNVAWNDPAVSYTIAALPNSTDAVYRRVAITNATFVEAKTNQMNITFPNSTGHKGVNMKIISNVKPSESADAACVVKSLAIDANLAFPKFAQQDGNYVFEAKNLMFNTEKPGMAFIWRTTAAATNGNITFEYNWID